MIQLRNSPMEKMHGQDMRAGEGECLRSVHALPGHITLPGPPCVYKSGSLPNLASSSLLRGQLVGWKLLPSNHLSSWWPAPSWGQWETHPVSPHLHKLRWDSGSLWITKDTPDMQESPRILGDLYQKLETMTKYIYFYDFIDWIYNRFIVK